MIYICFVFWGQQTVWWPLQSLDTRTFVVVVLPAVAVVVSVELFFFRCYRRCHCCRLCCICSCPCSSSPSSCYYRGSPVITGSPLSPVPFSCSASSFRDLLVFPKGNSYNRSRSVYLALCSSFFCLLKVSVCLLFFVLFFLFLFSFLFKNLFVRQNEAVVVVIVVL